MFALLQRLFPSRKYIPKSIYDFKVAGIDGGIIDFSQFRGKKILIVNTATMCGLAPQLGELETLYNKYKDKLIIVAFPSNSFMFQEPRNNKNIASYCSREYHISFPMAAKIATRGYAKSPVYVWLTEKKFNGLIDNKVRWNFQKYIINEKGTLTNIFAPNTKPLDPIIIEAIAG